MRTNTEIGVQFQFPQNYGTHLATLFQNIDTKKYIWNIVDSEILCYNEETKKVDEFTMDGTYIGKEFMQRMCQSSYYMIEARIFASPLYSDSKINDIADYDSFFHSKFEIVLLCADTYADFYAKEQRIINNVFNSAKSFSSSEVSFITVENDCRTNFCI